MDVDQLNIEIGVFLKRLRMYSDRKNAQINEKTAELLLDAILYIDGLIANAEMIPTIEPNNVKFLFDLNEQEFDLRQHIMCRLCSEQIGLSKDELEAHIQRKLHVHKPQKQALVTGNGLKAIEIERGSSERKASVDMNGATTMDSGYKDRDTISNHENGRSTVGSITESVAGFMTGSRIKVDKTSNVAQVADDDSQSANKKEELAPFNYDSTSFLIRANKIPWVATKEEIIDFFNDIKILNGVGGIHFIVDKTKNSSNDAFIQLASEKDYQVAMNLKVIRMGFSSVKLSPANMLEFMFLISKPNYPEEQRVLRLENLPHNCLPMEIAEYFYGRTILKVNLVENKENRKSAEAFVIFGNTAEVELALRQMEGKKIRNTLIKAFRSSDEQFRNYCEFKHEPSMPLRVYSVPDLSPKKKGFHDSTTSLKTNGNVYRILARGFQWQVTPEDVVAFFKNVNIIGGVNGINIKKNVAMEATFYVSSKEELNKALLHDKRQIDSRIIHVSQIKPNQKNF